MIVAFSPTMPAGWSVHVAFIELKDRLVYPSLREGCREDHLQMSKPGVDVAIVGAGILGLAHAWMAAKAGKSVVVFDRSPRAAGASVRNFGMIWPIGQPAGEMLALSLRSRELWLEVLEAAKLPRRETGSLHVAYRADEAAVIQEFAERGPALGYACEWLRPWKVLERSQAVEPHGLAGGLWSSTELTVDPRQIIQALPGYLTERYNVQFQFGSAVTAIEHPALSTGTGRWHADTIIVCGGEDFTTLYPEHYAASGLTRCKLQMLRTAPQPDGWQLGPSLAAGLTLRFYPAFQVCETLAAFSQRIAEETPEYDRWGIHALVSQTADGALTLGDSHEYGLAVDIFNKEEIDELILRYTRQFLRAPDLRIAERWHGVYAKHPVKPLVVMHPQPGVRIVASPGGSGMTLSFGVAEQSMRDLGWAHV
jgi:FAD dependent oxidoreductase TIGR03364